MPILAGIGAGLLVLSGWFGFIDPPKQSINFGALTVLKVSQGGTGGSTFTDGLCLVGHGTGPFTSGACSGGSGGGGADFTFGSLTFSTSTAATTTSLWTQGAFFSSSTVASSVFPYASTTAITSVTASTTNLNISGATTLQSLATGANRFVFITSVGVVSTVPIPLTVNNGATGFASFTPGDMLYASAVTSLAKIASTTSGTVLALVNGIPTWTATTTFSAPLTYSNGAVSCATCTAFTFPWSALTTFSTSTSATTTSVWTKGVFFSSSTVATSTFDGPALFGAASIFPYARVGSTTCPTNPAFYGYFEVCGNDNTLNGVQVQFGNKGAGTKSFTFLALLNDKSDTNLTNYAGIGLNGSNYNDSTFGTFQAVSYQMQMVNSMGEIAIWAATTSSANSRIRFGGMGLATENEWGRFENTGNFGLSTTTPGSKLSVQGNQFIAGNITSTSTRASIFPYASTTAASATQICFTGDTCRTTWPTAGAAFPFTPGTFFGAAGNATGTLIQDTGGLAASSTVWFGNAGVLGQFLWNGALGFLGLSSSTPNRTLSVGTGTASSSISVAEYAYGKVGNIATSAAMRIGPDVANTILWPIGGSATTLTLCNFQPGDALTVKIQNPNQTAGALTWAVCAGSQLYWPNKTLPTQTTTATDWDYWSFKANSPTGTTTTAVIISGAQIANF